VTRFHAALAAALVVVVAVHPLAIEAQQVGKVWRIGFISVAYMRIEDVFFRHLKDLGYFEGQNLVVERATPKDVRSVFPNLRRRSLDSTST
jgi:hypothetical protein